MEKNKISEILEDKREIEVIIIDEHNIIDKECASGLEFKVYGEPGEFCYLPWLAIYKDGEIIARINAQKIQRVIYKTDKDIVWKK